MSAPTPHASPPLPPDDHALLRAFVAGDQTAFAVLLRRHERMVFSVSLRTLGDPGSAQDAAQQTFLLLARHSSRLRPPVVIAGWLYHTARHQAETLRRSMQRRRLREQRAASELYSAAVPLASTSPVNPSPSPDTPAWHELSPRLDAALARLPARLRDAVVLCLLENQDRAAAAAQLGCSPDALAKRLARALDQLRSRLSYSSRPVTAGALAALLAQHGSESHAATLAPSVLAAPLAPATAALTTTTAFKLTTAAALLTLGAMFVLRTFNHPASPPVLATLTATAPQPSPSTPSPKTIPPASASTPAPAPPADTPPPDIAQALAAIPDTNPYKPALLAYAALTQGSDQANPNGAPEPTAAARLAARDTILRSLAAGRTAAEVEWGVDYTRGIQTTVPHVAPANKLTQALFKELPASATPSERRELALDVLAFGRHLGHDGALIELFSGIAVTHRALDQLEPLLADLSPAESARIAAELRKLPAFGTLATALAYEKAFFIDGFTRDLTEELATALETLSPPDPSQPAPTATEAAVARIVADLKLHGLIQEGRLTRVGLRSPTHTFWLSPGETRHGITLLSANVVAGNALLLVHNRPVHLNLEKGSFTLPVIDVLEAAARALPKESLTAFLLAQRPAGSITDLFGELDLSARQLTALYEEAIAHPEQFTEETAFWKRVDTLSPTAKNAAVALPKIITRLQAAHARESALLAKLDARAAAVSPKP